MKIKICFAFLFFLFILISINNYHFTVNAETQTKEFSLNRALEYALENNEELKLTKREIEVQKDKEKSTEMDINVNLDSQAGLNQMTSQIEPELSSDISVNLDKKILGGTFSGNWDTGFDAAGESNINSNVSLSFRRDLFAETDDQPVYTELKEEKNQLRKKVIQKYLTLLEYKKELELIKKEHNIKQDELNYYQKQDRDLELIENVQEQLNLIKEDKELKKRQINDNGKSFKKLLGISNGLQIKLINNIEYMNNIAEIDYWKEQAISNSTTYQQTKADLDELKNKKGKTWVDSEWEVDVRGGLRSHQIYPEFETSPHYYAYLEVSRDFNYLTKYEVQKKEIKTERKKIELNELKKRVKNQVEQNYQQLIENQKTVVELQGELIKAENDFEVLKKEYEAGLTGKIDYKKGEYEISKLKVDIFKAKSDLIEKYLNLKEDIGLNINWPLQSEGST